VLRAAQVELTIRAEPRRYRLLLPLESARPDLTLQTAAEQVGNDPRRPGAAVDAIDVVLTLITADC
jgi:hypothetical protein